MIRITVLLLGLVLAACSTTSTVHQPLPATGSQVPAHAYAYAFENHGGDDLEGIDRLDRLIQTRLLRAGIIAGIGRPSSGRVQVDLRHYYLRSNGARFWAGIMAGRDKIVSEVDVFDDAGNQIGSFEVETTNLSAWGTTEGLMEKHADEIVARLQH
ncbi:MAG: DUF4410 domain-containing protein [Luteimonas sp.]